MSGDFSGGGGGGIAGHVIEDEGTPLTQRADLNFVGGGVTAADAGGKTVVTVPGGGNVTQTGTPADNFITAANGDAAGVTAGTGSGAGSAGATADVKAGDGADNGAGAGGAGGDATLQSGDGGDGTTAGGTAGIAILLGGDGGASSVSGNGGVGGTAAFNGGKGGAANGATGNGGSGGSAEIVGGDGGASSGGSQGRGGNVTINGGSGDVNGKVFIGSNNTSEIVTGDQANKHKHQGGQYTPTKDLGSTATTVTPNLNNSNVFKVTLTGNVTLTFTNLSDGQCGYIQVTQDGAGSRTMVKGAGVTMPGGTITLSGGPGDIDVLGFVVDGASVRVWVEALAFS